MKKNFPVSVNNVSVIADVKPHIVILNTIVPFIIQLLLLVNIAQAQTTCCPEFRLKDAIEICPPEGACHNNGGTPDPGQGKALAACKESVHNYTVYPNDMAIYNYTWTIIGGTPATSSGNPVNINWGNGGSGFIKVVISGINGCVDSLMHEVCLMEGPKADFMLTPDTVCINTPVSFMNLSAGGSAYNWDFGDGNTSDLFQPTHSFATAGVYTVFLEVCDAGSGGAQGGELPRACGCCDTISRTIVVLPGKGPSIETDCCYGTVCPDFTSTFCSPDTCTTYNWTVTGGTIINGAGTNCIEVLWDVSYSVPTTVTLETPGCGPSPCPGITIINVPVLYPNLPINGPVIVCVGESGTYSLPHMPGTYYTWSVSGGPNNINTPDLNKANANITFNAPGSYTVQCSYNNPLSGCSGNSSIAVTVLDVFQIFGPDIVCEGDVINYTSNGNATWNVTPAGATFSPGPSPSNTITWNNPGTYLITATHLPAGTFCNPDAYKVVEVIAKPVLGAISGPAVACPNKNFTFSVTSNVIGSPFYWTVSSGTGIVHSQLGEDGEEAIIELTGFGPWTINVYQEIEISPGVFCQSLTQNLVVNPYPIPSISGLGTVCVDAIETYSTPLPSPPGGFQWSVSPSNRGSILSGQGTNTVAIRWHGTPTTANLIVTSCSGVDMVPISIVNPPFVAAITASGPTVYCLPGTPSNLVLSTTGGFLNYQWYQNGSSVGTNSNSYTIVSLPAVPGSYLYTVEVDNGVCVVYKHILVVVDNCPGGIPPPPPTCALDFTINPNPACVDQPVTFTALPSFGGFTFDWNFGDGSTSFTQQTEHTYTASGVYNVTLIGTFDNLCTLTVVKPVTVNPLPACNIISADTIFCPGDSLLLSACGGMSAYQWYKDETLIPGATNPTYYAIQQGEYYVVATNSFGCSDKSNEIYIYMHGLPRAKIIAQRSYCTLPGSTENLSLSAWYDASYSYSWSDIPSSASFSPNGSNPAYTTVATITLPGTLPYQHEFVLEVTDLITGCMNFDTICVTFYETPPLSTNWESGCEGTPYVLSATPADYSLYSYYWSHGDTTFTTVVTNTGFYGVTITDKTTGCSATTFAAMIFPKPDVSLFPLGCATIDCKDSLDMYIPLPLTSTAWNNTYPLSYPVIEWYDAVTNTLLGTGQTFPFNSPSAGNFELYVQVQNHFGCVDSAGVFCITVTCDELGDLDFGDAPDAINPPCYPTLLINNGARHTIVPGVYLGNLVDAEPDGQPTINADGDDLDIFYPSSGDDEDGVILPPSVQPGQTVIAIVTASVPGYLDAWIDFNINCNWADPGDHVLNTFPLNAGINDIEFTIPCDAVPGQTYARFRFRTDNLPISYDGAWPNGEVEDYTIFIEDIPCEAYDFGDAPECALAYLVPPVVGNFPTCTNNGPAGSFISHAGNYEALFGEFLDYESEGNANWCPVFSPNTYNMDECWMDGDAGLIMPKAYTIVGAIGSETIVPCADGPTKLWRTCKMGVWGANVDIYVTNNIGTVAYMNLLVDWNQDGQWGGVLPCQGTLTAPEHALVNFPVPNGFSGPLSALSPPNFRIGPKSNYVWARFSITESPVASGWTGTGIFNYGETEDYLLRVSPALFWDYLELKDILIPSGFDTCYGAIDSIVVGGNGPFEIEEGGEVTLHAGHTIRMLPGTKVNSGGYMEARIITDETYCANHRSLLVEDDEMDTEDKNTLISKIQDFNIFPNPTTGIINIELSELPTGTIHVQIFNPIGDQILSSELKGVSRYEFDLMKFPSGLYLVRLQYDSKHEVRRIIKH